MKKLLLLFFMSVSSMATFAQVNDYNVNENRLTFGLQEGISFSDFSLSPNGPGSFSSSTILSVDAGAFVDYKLDKMLSIRAGLAYIGLGSGIKTNTNNGGVTISSDTKTYLYYLRLPVNIIDHVHAGSNAFYFGGGLYAAYGIRGRTTGTINNSSEPKPTNIVDDLSFGNSPGNLKNMDYGIDPLIGFQFLNGFFMNLTYYYGLPNISNANTFSAEGMSSTVKNRSLSFTIGLNF